MSVTREATVWCDGPPRPLDTYLSLVGATQGAYSPDSRCGEWVSSDSAAAARREARAQGWRTGLRDPEGGRPRDLCRAHRDDVDAGTAP